MKSLKSMLLASLPLAALMMLSAPATQALAASDGHTHKTIQTHESHDGHGTAEESIPAKTPDSTTGKDDLAPDRTILYYRNPMGLSDTSPVPKKDSMGMDYIPVYAGEMPESDGAVSLSPEKIQRTGIRTQPVEHRTLTRSIRAAGKIVADETRIAEVAVKFDGFIEKLFVSRTGASVSAGAPLMRVWIESSDILRKQADLLSARRSDARQSAEANLRLFGLPQKAIDRILRDGQPNRSIELLSPIGGTVIEKNAIEGMRFSTGNSLFRIVDLTHVWIVADVSERDLGAVATGQPVTIRIGGPASEETKNHIAFVYPDLNEQTRTGRIRIEIANADGHLKLGQYADIRIETRVTPGPVITLPKSAILDSGGTQTAFIATGDGRFQPRALTLGARGDDDVEIRHGVSAGENVVVNGTFLIDAESNLRTAISALNTPEAAQ